VIYLVWFYMNILCSLRDLLCFSFLRSQMVITDFTAFFFLPILYSNIRIIIFKKLDLELYFDLYNCKFQEKNTSNLDKKKNTSNLKM